MGGRAHSAHPDKVTRQNFEICPWSPAVATAPAAPELVALEERMTQSELDSQRLMDEEERS